MLGFRRNVRSCNLIPKGLGFFVVIKHMNGLKYSDTNVGIISYILCRGGELETIKEVRPGIFSFYIKTPDLAQCQLLKEEYQSNADMGVSYSQLQNKRTYLLDLVGRAIREGRQSR